MPDEPIPAPVSSENTPSPTELPTQTIDSLKDDNDAVYKKSFAEAFEDETTETSDKKDVQTSEPDAGDQTTQDASEAKCVLTYSQQESLKRAKLDPSLVSQWSQSDADSFVSALIENQATQDRMGAEMARLKMPGDMAQPDQSQQYRPPQPEITPTTFNRMVKDTLAPMALAYDESILPLEGLFNDLDRRMDSTVESTQMIPAIAGLMSDLVLDMTIESMVEKYPSIKTTEARERVVDRFWTEWNTGAYQKLDVPLRVQIQQAALNAAKVVFMDVNEQTAVANLVTSNRSRVASQPKTGGPRTRQNQPMTQDEIYDAGFVEAFGS